jgi:steroid 5-alpha reductase family enzyme
MNEIWQTSLFGLGAMLAMAFIAWCYSLYRRNVNIVDSLWSLMFLAAALVYAASAETLTSSHVLLLGLVAIWSLRLSIFLVARNWGEDEDRRYQEIRANNEPYFNLKSLYIVFGLQALLAWVISIPLLMAISAAEPNGTVVIVAAVLWLAGFIFEASADDQLYRFKSNPNNQGKVLNTGVWAYSRHPNYFGEFLIWWAYYLFALSAGAWWTLFSPLLMTLLLLKVSGVSLMEKGIIERRAKYREYIETTNAFFPGKPKLRHSDVYIEGGQKR